MPDEHQVVRPRLRPDLPVIAIAIAGVWLAWRGVREIGTGSVGPVVAGARAELIGPAVAAFVAVLFVVERLRPAQPRPARRAVTSTTPSISRSMRSPWCR